MAALLATLVCALMALAPAAPAAGLKLGSNRQGQNELVPRLGQTVRNLSQTVNQVTGGLKGTVDQTVQQVTQTTKPKAPASSKPAAPAPTSTRTGSGATTPRATGGGSTSGSRTNSPSTGGSGRGATPGRARTGGATRRVRSSARRRAARRRASAASAAARSRGDRERKPRTVRTENSAQKSSPVARTVRDIVEVVPPWARYVIGALGALSLVLAGGYLSTGLRARRLDRQRGELLQEVGLLQTALLPPVPPELGGLRTSVAYRPADGPGAGGDFYDAVQLGDGRVGLILGDVSGHGRQALARTAFMRYTLRAYLEAGLEPRLAVQVAGRAVGDNLGGDFATVVVAVHDERTGSLTYACAGHPAPIITGAGEWEPVLAGGSPPIGIGEHTGLRQTTVPLPAGAIACFYTDGLAEARTEDVLLGRGKLSDLVADTGADAQGLLDSVAAEAERVEDDMASIMVTPRAEVTTGGFRSEQIEVDRRDIKRGLAKRFLLACEVSEPDAETAVEDARRSAERFGSTVLVVSYGVNGRTVRLQPSNVESLLDASSRLSVAAPPL